MARKILLADDSVTAQNMGRKILTDAGYDVITVNNGSAALKKIAELKPEIVILDVYMPGYSGLEVCQRLKDSPETARIPVLLSVGKLEPFKPQEAQRVRADSYIVKPFEASELLSALARLEDKIVPRAEDSKAGRFARATEKAEVGGTAKEGTGDAGWKSRLSSPRKKSEAETDAEDKGSDTAEIYNMVNRDLRTVIENSAENLAGDRGPGKKESEITGGQEYRAESGSHSTLDAGALGPSDLPKDVTLEEIAALRSAAAKMHMAGAEAKEKSSDSETPGIGETPNPGAPANNNESRSEVFRSEETGVQEIRSKEVHREEVHREENRREEASPEGLRAEEDSGEPVTMAAATHATQSEPTRSVSAMAESASGSCWMAIPAPLGTEEQGLSLELEMQRSYPLSSLAAELVSADQAATAEPVHPDPAQSCNPASSNALEIPVLSNASAGASANASAETGAQPQVQSSAGSVIEEEAVEVTRAECVQAEVALTAVPQIPIALDSSSAAAEVTESGVEHHEPTAIASIPAEVAATPGLSGEVQSANGCVQVHQEPTPVADFTGSNAGFIAVEPQTVEAPVATNPLSEAGATAAEDLVQSASAEATLNEATLKSSSAFTGDIRETESAAEIKLDPEAVKNSAAAWASWRQIRDTTPTGALPTSAADGEEKIAPLSETAAMAAAAGAERAAVENPVSASARHSAEVASIVDSVLADLRPKLMEEISRKMAQKK